MVTVSQLDQSDRMRGLITTLNKTGPTLVPVSAPILYVKQAELPRDRLGEIGRSHPAYPGYRQLLQEAVRDGYVRLVQP